MDVVLKAYEPSMYREMVRAVAQESFLKMDVDDLGWRELLRPLFEEFQCIVRAVFDAGSGAFVGYCEINDTTSDEWEVGVTILREHWRKGAGTAAVRSLMREVAEEHGRRQFIAKIAPDNVASVRLFQKLGATPKRIERSRFVWDDESAANFEEEHMDMIDDHLEEMAALFGVAPKKLLSSVLVFDVSINLVEECSHC